MPAYQYQAVRLSDQQKTSGVIQADSERAARELLREQDLFTTSLTVIEEANNLQNAFGLKKFLARFGGKVTGKDKMIMFRNLAIMLRSGLPLSDSLYYLESYSGNPRLGNILGQVRKQILNGEAFSQALGRHKGMFNEVSINLVKAGEATGELETTLNRLVELMGRQEDLKKKLISVSIYPCVVLSILSLVMTIMFLFVVPSFQDIYKKMGVELPLVTQLMVDFSAFIRAWWFVLIPSLFFGVYKLFAYVTSGGGRAYIDSILIKIPGVGDLITLVNNANFLSTFQVAFAAGIPITEAIPLAVQTLSHTEIRAAFRKVTVKLQGGQKLGSALSQTKIIPPMVLMMLSTGEESGQLDVMLKNAIDYMEEEVKMKVEIVSGMMEPLLLVFMGLAVGVVAMGIYMPMFSMYEHV